jgi:hypothetical protein
MIRQADQKLRTKPLRTTAGLSALLRLAKKRIGGKQRFSVLGKELEGALVLAAGNAQGF